MMVYLKPAYVMSLEGNKKCTVDWNIIIHVHDVHVHHPGVMEQINQIDQLYDKISYAFLIH